MYPPWQKAIDRAKCLFSRSVIIKKAVGIEIDIDERNSPLEDARGIKDDAVAGCAMDKCAVATFLQYLI